MRKLVAVGLAVAGIVIALLIWLAWEEEGVDFVSVSSPEPRGAEIAESQAPAAPAADAPASAPTPVAERGPDSREQVAAIPEDQFWVGGRVENEDGDPVAGADLVLYHDTKTRGLDDTVAGQTMSGVDGSFRFPELVAFNEEVNHSYAQDTFVVFASHPEYAVAWANVVPAADHSNYVVVMTKASARELTVVDDEGAPVEGAAVWPYSIGTNSDEDPKFRDRFGVEGRIDSVVRYSDADGIVRFENLPDTKASFYAEKPGYARTIAFSHSDIIVLTRGATLSGSVLDQWGKPLTGVMIVLDADWMSYAEMTRSGADGRYAFVDMPANGWDMSTWRSGHTGTGRYTMTLDDAGAYTMLPVNVALEPGDAITDFDLTAYAGTLVRCQVLTSDAQEPMPGARIQGFSTGGRLNGYTDENGYIEFRAMPGETRLIFLSPPEGIYVVNERNSGQYSVEFMAEGEEVEVTLLAPPIGGPLADFGGSVSWPERMDPEQVLVHASAGSNIELSGLTGGYGAEVGLNQDGTFEFKGVPTGLTTNLYAISEDSRYGGVGAVILDANGGGSENVEIELEPTYTVDLQIADDEGNPITNTVVRVAPVLNGQWISRANRRLPVDEFGQVTVDGVVQGIEYRVETGSWVNGAEGSAEYIETIVLAP